MSGFLGNTLVDAQTTITSLGAAVGGAASEVVGSYVIGAAGLRKNDGGLGSAGLAFVAQAIVSAVGFSVTASLMPETSGNIFFSIVFFASNPTLVNSAVTIGTGLVDAITKSSAGALRTRAPHYVPSHGKKSPPVGPTNGSIGDGGYRAPPSCGSCN